MIVESAMIRPHSCVGCRGTKGPFLDTCVDALEFDGRVYLCMLCLRQWASEAGFAPGGRMDDFADAKVTVEHAEAETEKRNAQIASLEEVKVEQQLRLAAAYGRIELLEGEIKKRDLIASSIRENVNQLTEVQA